MKFSTLLRRLIFVPTCVICKERLSPFTDSSISTHGRACLCNSCYKKWREATGELCTRCAMPSPKCTCIPKFLTKYYSKIPSLFFYESDEDNAQNKVIYSLKRIKNRELTEFLAFELYPHVVGEIDNRNLSRDSLIFTWIPRKSSSISKYGFDQGKELARALARLFGGKAYPIFLRLGGKEQKKLDVEQRKENLEKSVILNYNLLGFPLAETKDDIKLILENKNIVIVDDIITTGASMARVTELLRSVCNGEIIIASVAKTRKYI